MERDDIIHYAPDEPAYKMTKNLDWVNLAGEIVVKRSELVEHGLDPRTAVLIVIEPDNEQLIAVWDTKDGVNDSFILPEEWSKRTVVDEITFQSDDTLDLINEMFSPVQHQMVIAVGHAPTNVPNEVFDDELLALPDFADVMLLPKLIMDKPYLRFDNGACIRRCRRK